MAKAEQTEIPGTEQKRIPSLETAAKKFAEKRRLHAAMTKDKKNAAAKLVEKLVENKEGLEFDGDAAWSYNRGGFKLLLSEKETVRCEVPGEEVVDTSEE